MKLIHGTFTFRAEVDDLLVEDLMLGKAKALAVKLVRDAGTQIEMPSFHARFPTSAHTYTFRELTLAELDVEEKGEYIVPVGSVVSFVDPDGKVVWEGVQVSPGTLDEEVYTIPVGAQVRVVDDDGKVVWEGEQQDPGLSDDPIAGSEVILEAPPTPEEVRRGPGRPRK